MILTQDERTLRTDRLLDLLDDMGLSPNALSTMLGKDRSWLRKIIGGSVAMPRGTGLRQLAEALNTTDDYLLGYTDDPRPRAPAPVAPAQEAGIDRGRTYKLQLPGKVVQLFLPAHLTDEERAVVQAWAAACVAR